ncbi:MAG TPA: hypothetical protein VNQ52_12570 [Microbacteriaceae bacterium]|nr:hypothetical protein [Microbacteriaceae bacterium]
MSLKGKLVLIGLGVGVGYILGAKAGRERYEQIANAASTVWNAPIVQGVRATATGFVDARLDDLAGLLKIGAASAIDRATGAKRRSGTSSSARKPSGTSTRRSTSAAKSGSKSGSKAPPETK